MHPERRIRITLELALVAVALMALVTVNVPTVEHAHAQQPQIIGLIDTAEQWPLNVCVLSDSLLESTQVVINAYNQILGQEDYPATDAHIRVIPPIAVPASDCTLKISEEDKESEMANQPYFFSAFMLELGRYEFLNHHLIIWDSSQILVQGCTLQRLISHEFAHAMLGDLTGYTNQLPDNPTHSDDQNDLLFPQLDLSPVTCDENDRPFLSELEKAYLLERFWGNIAAVVG